VHFLGALAPARRAALLAAARAELKEHLELLGHLRVRDEFSRLSLRVAVGVARARLAWLNGLANSSPRKSVRGFRKSGD
jgi:hypothetical protein